MSIFSIFLIFLLLFLLAVLKIAIPLVVLIVFVVVALYFLFRPKKETDKDSYKRYLASDEWKAKRNTILKMAGYRCRICGKRATQVHHETYRRVFNEKLTDLTALCNLCHQRKHE